MTKVAYIKCYEIDNYCERACAEMKEGQMEEDEIEKTTYSKDITCPGCGQSLSLHLSLSKIKGDIYVWFEGLCNTCCHKIVDPLPKVRVELNDMLRQIISN